MNANSAITVTSIPDDPDANEARDEVGSPVGGEPDPTVPPFEPLSFFPERVGMRLRWAIFN
jgi:hypothetical protein